MKNLFRPVAFALALCLATVVATAADSGAPAAPPAKAHAPKPNRQQQFLERAKDKDIQLVFLGDSITDFWSKRGKDVWAKYYTKYDAADFGVSGETTDGTMSHITKGVLDGLHPKAVVIMIGTNNIGRSKQPSDTMAAKTAEGVKTVVKTVHEKLPDTKVLLLAIFPRGQKTSWQRTTVDATNAIISKLDDGNKTRYLDLGPKFLDADGAIPKDIMPDGLHPSAKGYQIWAENMQPLLDELMK